MKLICGLGNPGREYAAHRHNVGFMVVDALSAQTSTPLSQGKFDGRWGQGAIGGEKLLLLEPQTFMNRSGQSLAPLARFYKVTPEDILVIHDELDLPFGRLQLKRGGGTGGHNGLESIVDDLGDDGFVRLRFGVGKPAGPNAKERVVGHVLSGFNAEERAVMQDLIAKSAEAATTWARSGLAVAMNQFNRK
jgi:PTH1 family peptidyl-tRNA hydrolase